MIRPAACAIAILLLVGVPVSAQVKLENRLQLKAGQKNTVLSNTIITQVMTINGSDIETNVEQLTQISEEVGKRDANGNVPVKQKFDVFRMQLGLPGGVNVNFDSAKPDEAKSEIPQLQQVLDLLKKTAVAKWTVNYNADSRVESVKYDGDPFADFDDKLKQEADPERAKHRANQIFDRLPGKVVKPGESWKRTEKDHIGSGQTLEFEHEFTYEGPVDVAGKKLHKVNQKTLTVKYDMQGNNGPAQVTGSDLKIESSSGHMLYDPERGMLVHFESKVRIDGTLKLKVAGQELNADLDLIIESRTEMQ